MARSTQINSEKFNTTSPAITGQTWTPDDSNEIPFLVRGVMVASGGDLAVRWADDPSDGQRSTVTLPGLQPGIIYPVSPLIILSTGTTASGIVLLG